MGLETMQKCEHMLVEVALTSLDLQVYTMQ